VSFVQRFGGSLNLNVHPHVLALDGVCERNRGGRVVFRRTPSPTRDDIAWVARAFARRFLRWLRRRGLLRAPGTEGEGTNDATIQEALEGSLSVAATRGSLQRVDQCGRVHPADPDDLRFGARMESRWSATVDGFNVHAGVRVRAGEDEARERLCRYAARPAFALDRLSVLRDGWVAYRVKYAPSAAATHRVMTPIEFLARLAALVPPPRYPLTRYHGVLGPASRWRKSVVPRPREPSPSTVERPTNVLSARHWARLRNGLDLAPEGRICWATLLRRTFAVDVLTCPSCGGRMEPLDIVIDPDQVSALVARLGLDGRSPPLARARDPTDDFEVASPDSAGEEPAGWELDDDQVPRQGEFDFAE
jgi:hypothetical protein